MMACSPCNFTMKDLYMMKVHIRFVDLLNPSFRSSSSATIFLGIDFVS
jgi:hypothetical protein